MKITIETPTLIGHILQTDTVGEQSTTHDTAMCGAKVRGPIENSRWVCSRCAKLLIANRNDVNATLDSLERQAKNLRLRLFDALDTIDSLTPEKDVESSEDSEGQGEGDPEATDEVTL